MQNGYGNSGYRESVNFLWKRLYFHDILHKLRITPQHAMCGHYKQYSDGWLHKGHIMDVWILYFAH